MPAGRADLWDGQWRSEMRPRKTVEGSDNYFEHPVWTKDVRDMQRRSVDDALRLVGIIPRKGRRRVRAAPYPAPIVQCTQRVGCMPVRVAPRVCPSTQ